MVKKTILGVSCLIHRSTEDAFQQLRYFIESGGSGYSVAINAEKIYRAHNDNTFKDIINESIFPVADGSGAVIGLKILYGVNAAKIDFPKLVLEIASLASSKVFVFGANEEANLDASEFICSRYPNIRLVGRLNGYASDSELRKLLDDLKPRIVFLGIGTPKQELLAVKLSKEYEEIFFVCCGGAIDSMAGNNPRAPSFFVENHLEWLYRLFKNPSRWRRQTVLPKFVLLLLKAYIFKK